MWCSLCNVIFFVSGHSKNPENPIRLLVRTNLFDRRQILHVTYRFDEKLRKKKQLPIAINNKTRTRIFIRSSNTFLLYFQYRPKFFAAHHWYHQLHFTSNRESTIDASAQKIENDHISAHDERLKIHPLARAFDFVVRPIFNSGWDHRHWPGFPFTRWNSFRTGSDHQWRHGKSFQDALFRESWLRWIFLYTRGFMWFHLDLVWHISYRRVSYKSAKRLRAILFSGVFVVFADRVSFLFSYRKHTLMAFNWKQSLPRSFQPRCPYFGPWHERLYTDGTDRPANSTPWMGN